MGKPTKLSSAFFYHDADMRNDIKIKALRRKFSHKGYTVWCCLLEMLTDAEGLEIEFSEISQELIAADLDVEVSELRDIVTYCQQIGLFQMTEQGCLYSQAHQERLSYFIEQKIARSEARREAGRLGGLKSGESRRQKALSESNTEAIDNQNEATPEANGSIGNLSKVKESKGDKNKEKDNMEYPYADIVSLWNATCLSLPKVCQLNDSRRGKIKCRLNEWGKTPEEMLARAKEIFSRCASSAFLCGDNKSDWTATFDWLFENDKNWVKVMEGNYDNNRGSQRQRTQGGIELGVGEFFDESGRRTYGTGKITIPPTAPPRPSDRYSWDAQSQTWIML